MFRQSYAQGATQHSGPRSGLRWLVVVGVLLMGLLATAGPVLAAPAPPVQIYYLPVPEDQVLSALRGVYPGNVQCGYPAANAEVNDPVITYVSISILAGGTEVYYDHWEDGYEVDMSVPVQSTTEVWGDGNLNNGVAPGVPTDLFEGNTVVVLRNNVNSTTLQSVIDIDGRDRIGATRAIALTRSAWATGTGTLHAGALEGYPVSEWGTRYRVPVGTDTAALDMFEYTSLAIMAAEPNTQVAVDANADGTFDLNATLAQGESYLTPGATQEGAVVSATAPVQVAMITGDICSNFESRWFVLFPEEQWDDAYYNPVSTQADRGTTVFLHNPATTPLTITREISGSVVATLEVGAGATISNVMPQGTGAAYVSVDGRRFGAVVAVDSTEGLRETFDWGIDLIPEARLTAQTLIGWGPGRDPDSSVNPTENGSPVWVMPIRPANGPATVRICVDYNSDNAGAFEDANGFKYDRLLELAEYANERVFDPDGDQTGMLLYVCDADSAQPSGARLVAAWGQDPATASGAEPGLDSGTTAPPSASFEAGKGAEVIVDLDGDGKADGGDTLRYNVVIFNSSRVTLPNVIVSDTLPAYTSYVLSSTTAITASTPVSVADSLTGTAFPLDEGGIDLGPMPIAGVFTVTFDVALDDPLPDNVDRIVNVAFVTVGGETDRPEVETPVDRDPGIALTKSASSTSVIAGRTVTYTFNVTNSGEEPLQTVVLADNRCQTTYTGGDVDGDDILDLPEVWTYVCTAVITQTTVNTATVTAVNPTGEPVTDTASALVTIFSGNLYLPIIITPPLIVPCPPPNGCPLTGEIKAMAVHEGSNRLYVVSRAPANELLLVNPDSVEVISRTATGPEPWGVAVNEITNRVYVASYGATDVRVYDAQTLAPLATVAVSGKPSLIELLPDLDLAFVLLRSNGKVAIIQGTTLLAEVDSGGSGAFGIAADRVNNRVFISHRDSVEMTMLRQEGGTWKYFPGPIFDDGRQLFELDYNPDVQKLYVVYAEAGGTWKLQAWEPKDNDLWGQQTAITIPTGGDVGSSQVGGAGLEVNPKTENVFNVNTGADNVSVVDGFSNGVLATVGLGDDPFSIAINAETNTVFIGLRGSGNLVKLADEY
jgi:uncharacterized repeat protein (TIGR01451 family)